MNPLKFLESLHDRSSTVTSRLRRRHRRPIQAGVLAWKRQPDGEIRFLLVTGRRSKQWLIPKGWPLIGKSFAEAATREALEEAGIEGEVGQRALGTFTHTKTHLVVKKLDVEIVVFPMRVTHELDDWREARQRQRRWHSVNEAIAAVHSPKLREIIEKFSSAAAGNLGA